MNRPKESTTFEDSFSEEVWRQTYKDHSDATIDDTFWRVAKAIASVETTDALKEEWSKKFYDMMTNFKVVPGGRIMANAGTEFKGTTLINCFVSPEVSPDPDSINGILKSLKNQSLTLKSEGGWGHNFSMLRPRGAFIEGIGVESPGSIRFMELFDKSSEIITSGSGLKSVNKKAKGKIRKGAMMGVMDVWHPDIIEFITAKQTSNRLSKFNISVNCNDDFMTLVLKVAELKKKSATQDEIDAVKWDLIFPDTNHASYKTEWNGDIRKWQEKGYPVRVYQSVSVDWLWNLITQSTYNRNEPGILFLDRANKFNQFNYGETIHATNPCGEQMLAPGSICCLGTLNLTQFVNKDRTHFDLDRIKKYTKYLVRFLDNVNTYSDAPLPEYIYAMRQKRRIGCGLMGWGSALMMMRVRFGSDKADKIRTELLETFTTAGISASIDLAQEKGMFPLCIPEKHSQSAFWDNVNLSKNMREAIKKHGIRNSSMFSCQPNGNSSVFANVCSGGIEPIFMPEYIRTVIVSTTPDHIKAVTPDWSKGEWYETSMFKNAKEGDEDILKGVDEFGTTYKIDRNRGLTKEVLCQDYGVRVLSNLGLWDKNADWAATTTELTVAAHIKDMQGFAKFIDSALSKTVNLPSDYPFADFQSIYLDSYNSGYIKGMTTYRAGSMTAVLSAVEQKAESQSQIDTGEEVIVDDIRLPDSSRAEVKVLRDHEGGTSRKWYTTIIFNENDAPVGLFVQTNALEKSVIANDTVDNLIELARTKGIPENFVTSTVEKCKHDSNSTKITRAIGLLLRHGVRIRNIVSTLDKVDNVTFGSFVFQLKKLLSSYIKNNEIVPDQKCSQCGGTMRYESGCTVCSQCGSSKCS